MIFWPHPTLRIVKSAFFLVVIVFAEIVNADHDKAANAEQVLEIFQQHCINCHNEIDRDGGLSLFSRDTLKRGGDSGPIIDTDSPEASVLLEQIISKQGRAEMPKNSSPLTEEQFELIRAWVIGGAQWPEQRFLHASKNIDSDWWSLRPLIRPMVPVIADVPSPVESDYEGVNPIDAFVFEKLQSHQINFSPEASRRTLIRRIYFSLIGLPPTPEEIDQFLGDDQPGAIERLVDRLLGSPHYGEHWARYWMDIVHYADTHGYDKDQPRVNAWPYRDYLVRSFNQDKAWGRMIREQIAGDGLYPGSPDAIEALGFLAAGPWDLVGHAEVPESKIDGQIARHLDRDDMVRTTLQSFMSLTAGCAQCHNHKFDPIEQVEYYQLQAVFAAIDRTDRPYFEDQEMNSGFQKLLSERRTLEKQIEKLENSIEQVTEHPEVLALKQQRQVVADLLAAMPTPMQVYAGTVHDGTGNFRGTGHVHGAARQIRMLARGDVTKPVGEVIKPGGLKLVAGLKSNWSLTAETPDTDRRVAMAEWLADEGNSFTWRSIVNRVWQHHFGQGLVDTVDDFGRMGGTPSHPELLDWLAVEFRDGGQSLKQLHRWILTSRTYRQSSTVSIAEISTQRAISIDQKNRLLWRGNRRRLEAEAVRDAILMLAGRLDLSMGGPGYKEFVMLRPEHSPHYRYDLHDFEQPDTHRRSVYRFIVRSQLHPLMTALDCADPSQLVAKRNESLSPLQALAMMNNGLIMTMSCHFAARLNADSFWKEGKKVSLSQTLSRGFEEATGRKPDIFELDNLETYATEFGLENCCRVLFNLNEFLYVD
jgi:mono/diheme cytochrome c family protein/uncharacterized protein YdcH (DUF465 family)